MKRSANASTPDAGSQGSQISALMDAKLRKFEHRITNQFGEVIAAYNRMAEGVKTCVSSVVAAARAQSTEFQRVSTLLDRFLSAPPPVSRSLFAPSFSPENVHQPNDRDTLELRSRLEVANQTLDNDYLVSHLLYFFHCLNDLSFD